MKFVATLITIVLNSKQPTCSPTEGVSAWWGLSQGKAQEGGRGNLKAPTGTGDRHKAYAEQKEPDAKDRAPCDSIDRKFKNRQNEARDRKSGWFPFWGGQQRTSGGFWGAELELGASLRV